MQISVGFVSSTEKEFMSLCLLTFVQSINRYLQENIYGFCVLN